MDYEDGSSRTLLDQPSDDPLLRFASRNVTLLAPIVAALIFAIRCVIVSEGDVYTVGILITQTSIGDAIRALLFPMVPATLLITSLTVTLVGTSRYRIRDPRCIEFIGLGVITSVLAFLFYDVYGLQGTARWVLLVMAGLFPVCIAVMMLVLSDLRRRRTGYRLGMPTRTALLFTVPLLLPIIILGAKPAFGETFWLPHERLIFRNEAPFTGYVLKTNEDRLVILEDQSRVIVQKPKTALLDRDFCYPVHHKARSSKMAPDAPICP